jgi:purine-binding chemotaxis protein CheW
MTGKHFTFAVGQKSYGVPISKVKEIIRMVKITPLPQMPEHVRGVINLRGKVIPIVDLRVRFGLTQSETTDHTCIVVVHLDQPEHVSQPMGMIVDAVEEVIQVGKNDIEQAPDLDVRKATDCVLGTARVRGGIKVLLDIEKAVGAEMLQLLGSSN